MQNRRYVLTRPGHLELVEEAVPTPGSGEILVRIRAGLTCGTDIKMFERGHPKLKLPAPFGHEASGDIVETGPGVDGFREGDRVMFPISAPCGNCAYCRLNRENLCETLMERKLWGTFATYVVIPSHIVTWQTYRIPADVSYAQAALLDPLASVLFAWQTVHMAPPGPLLILGAGAIAYMHALVALERGFSPVIVAGRRSHRLKHYDNLPVETVIASDSLDEQVRELTDGLGAEVVIDTTGSPSVWNPGMTCCRGGGIYLAFAGCEEGSEACLETTILHYEQLTVAGSFHYDRQAVAAAYTAITSGSYSLERVLSGTYPFEKLPEAMDQVRSGKGLKYVIEI